MKLDHIPDGSFKRVLSNRRKFPKLKRDEVDDIATELKLGSKFEIIDLRKEPKFSYLCEFADKLCDFLKIPPLNIYWIPQYIRPHGYLTPDSCSIVLAGPINSLQQLIAEAIVGHEFGHGFQGELERRAARDPDLAPHYNRLMEFHSDATSATLGSWWGTYEMLKMFENLQLENLGIKRDSAEDDISKSPLTEPSENYPSPMARRMSSVQIILSKHRRNFFEDLRAEGKEPDFCQRGVDFVDRVHRERIFDIINQAPFHQEPESKYSYSGWQFEQTKKYGIPPPEFAFRR